MLSRISTFQEKIDAIYGARNRRRGAEGVMLHLVEELGEVARSIRREDLGRQREELGDVLTWVASLATVLGVSLEDAVQRYSENCPYCGQTPCVCPDPRLPSERLRSGDLSHSD